jgi:hypothetical protein
MHQEFACLPSLKNNVGRPRCSIAFIKNDISLCESFHMPLLGQSQGHCIIRVAGTTQGLLLCDDTNNKLGTFIYIYVCVCVCVSTSAFDEHVTRNQQLSSSTYHQDMTIGTIDGCEVS